jgi:hypothetical protein
VKGKGYRISRKTSPQIPTMSSGRPKQLRLSELCTIVNFEASIMKQEISGTQTGLRVVLRSRGAVSQTVSRSRICRYLLVSTGLSLVNPILFEQNMRCECYRSSRRLSRKCGLSSAECPRGHSTCNLRWMIVGDTVAVNRPTANKVREREASRTEWLERHGAAQFEILFPKPSCMNGTPSSQPNRF